MEAGGARVRASRAHAHTHAHTHTRARARTFRSVADAVCERAACVRAAMDRQTGPSRWISSGFPDAARHLWLAYHCSIATHHPAFVAFVCTIIMASAVTVGFEVGDCRSTMPRTHPSARAGSCARVRSTQGKRPAFPCQRAWAGERRVGAVEPCGTEPLECACRAARARDHASSPFVRHATCNMHHATCGMRRIASAV